MNNLNLPASFAAMNETEKLETVGGSTAETAVKAVIAIGGAAVLTGVAAVAAAGVLSIFGNPVQWIQNSVNGGKNFIDGAVNAGQDFLNRLMGISQL